MLPGWTLNASHSVLLRKSRDDLITERRRVKTTGQANIGAMQTSQGIPEERNRFSSRVSRVEPCQSLSFSLVKLISNSGLENCKENKFLLF